MKCIAPERQYGYEYRDRAYRDDENQPGEADGETGLQQELVEADDRQPVAAAAGQAALAPQLHQNAFAVGLVRPSP